MPKISIAEAQYRNIPKLSLQSILFNKHSFTKKKAVDWLKRHGYHYNTSRLTTNFIRFRQIPDIDQAEYFTKKITPSIDFVFQRY